MVPCCSFSIATFTSAATSMRSTWASRCKILAAMAQVNQFNFGARIILARLLSEGVKSVGYLRAFVGQFFLE